MNTLQVTLTPEMLGPEADAYDMRAFNEAFARALMADQGPNATECWFLPDEIPALLERVLQGLAGRDEQGRCWVRVAHDRRAAQ